MSLPDPRAESAPPIVVDPTDPVFDRWLEDDFIWLPDRGMGRVLPKHPAPYDRAYFDKYKRMAETAQGHAITAERVRLVNRYTDRHVCDVGIGCGAFIEARKGWTWGYDVNPVAIRWLHANARWMDPYGEPFEAVSLWDVLEHIPEPAKLLQNVKRFVFMSVPIVPGLGPPSPTWKHFKPGEHIWLWTKDGLVRWFAEHGFQAVHSSTVETTLGREDIGTFVFERRAW